MPKTAPRFVLSDNFDPPSHYDDFTLFFPVCDEDEWGNFLCLCKTEGFRTRLEKIPAFGNPSKHSVEKAVYSIEETIVLVWEKNGLEIEARSLICLCNQTRTISITARILETWKKGVEQTESVPPSNSEPSINKNGGEGRDCVCNDGVHNYYHVQEKDGIFCDFSIIVKQLGIMLFGKSGSAVPRGLFVVSGKTNTGKSKIVRGLIWYLLTTILTPKSEKRNRHLVTCEDPIECPIISTKKHQPLDVDYKTLSECGLDYTPRQIGKDTPSLSEALACALRQTPSIFYVGEVRREEDWKHILSFAGTGHFIIVTTHASSLTETLSRIFKAIGANDPSTKGFYAESIFGITHLSRVELQDKEIEIQNKPVKIEAVLPAVWKSSPSTIAALVSDGLTSLLPRGDLNSSGRSHFFEKLRQNYRWTNKFTGDNKDALFDKLAVQAKIHDLKGS